MAHRGDDRRLAAFTDGREYVGYYIGHGSVLTLLSVEPETGAGL